MIRIAIQSNLELKRSSFALLFQQFREFKVVFEVENNKQLEIQLAQNAVALVVYWCDVANEMDWNALNQLSSNHPNLVVLLLTNGYHAEVFQKVLDSDYMGYIKEDVSVTELKKAILQLHNKGYYHEKNLYDYHKQHLRNCKCNAATTDGLSIKLTKMERLLMPSFFKGMTSKEIGVKHIMNEETIKSHRRNILQKTNSNSMAEACYKLLVNNIVTLEQLILHLFLAFCLLGNGLDVSNDNTSDDLDENCSVAWLKLM